MTSFNDAAEYFKLNNHFGDCDLLEDTVSNTKVSTRTANALELQDFYSELFVPTTNTIMGRTILAHSFISPPKDINLIRQKQEAVRELKENPELGKNIRNILKKIHYSELGPYRMLHKLYFGSGQAILETREVIKYTIDDFTNLEGVESAYLKNKIEGLRQLKNTDLHRISKEMIYRQGLRTPLHLRQLDPKCLPWIVPNTISPFRPVSGAIMSALTGLALYGYGKLFYDFANIDPSTQGLLITSGIFFTGVAGILGAIFSGSIERGISLPPLRRKLESNEGALTAYRTYGELDEVLALSKFATDMEERGISMVQPTVVETPKHKLYCENLVNIRQALTKDYIPNKVMDLDANKEGMNFVTGPNSGGKTSSSKAAILLQIMGQMGSYVSATKAILSPADIITYQVGLNDSQDDDEGGYGTQLAHSRTILKTVTPQSFTVVDDLMAGTEQEAMTRQTRNQFYGLFHIGGDVLMISHRHDLAREFKENTGRGNYLQIEFKGDHPTRQLIPGIAPTSRPDLVENRVHMGKNSIEGLLRERGFLADEQGLYEIR